MLVHLLLRFLFLVVVSPVFPVRYYSGDLMVYPKSRSHLFSLRGVVVGRVCLVFLGVLKVAELLHVYSGRL